MSGNIRKVIILKAGGVPVNDSWYIQQVLDAIRLPITSIEGAEITVRNVDSHSLNHTYVTGLVMGLGIDPDRCNVTPFSDADGGRGMVVKVHA